MNHEINFSDPGASGVIQDLQTILNLIRQIKAEGGMPGGGVSGQGSGSLSGVTSFLSSFGAGAVAGSASGAVSLLGLGGSKWGSISHKGMERPYIQWPIFTKMEDWVGGCPAKGARKFGGQNFNPGTGGGTGLGRRGWSGEGNPFLEAWQTKSPGFNLFMDPSEWKAPLARLGRGMIKQTVPLMGRGFGPASAIAATMKGISLADRLGLTPVSWDTEHLRPVDYRNQSAIQLSKLEMRQRAGAPKNDLERRNFALYEAAREYEGSSSWFKFNRGWTINFHDSSLMTHWTLDDPVNKGLVDDVSKELRNAGRYMGAGYDGGKRAYQIGAEKGNWEEAMRLQVAEAVGGKPYVRPAHKRVFSRATSG